MSRIRERIAFLIVLCVGTSRAASAQGDTVATGQLLDALDKKPRSGIRYRCLKTLRRATNPQAGVASSSLNGGKSDIHGRFLCRARPSDSLATSADQILLRILPHFEVEEFDEPICEIDAYLQNRRACRAQVVTVAYYRTTLGGRQRTTGRLTVVGQDPRLDDLSIVFDPIAGFHIGATAGTALYSGSTRLAYRSGLAVAVHGDLWDYETRAGARFEIARSALRARKGVARNSSVLAGTASGLARIRLCSDGCYAVGGGSVGAVRIANYESPVPGIDPAIVDALGLQPIRQNYWSPEIGLTGGLIFTTPRVLISLNTGYKWILEGAIGYVPIGLGVTLR
jgi:hypothetical protein